MQLRKKSQPSLWLLSGTGEGPSIARAFLAKGWKVSVSVVSYQASFAYIGLDLERLFIGPLNGVQGIYSVIDSSKNNGNVFDFIIDATHPFAEEITSNLINACEKLGQTLIRFERPIEKNNGGKLIKNLKELEHFDLRGQKLLFAIGSRSLPEAYLAAKSAGAEVFARILPSKESLIKAFSSQIPQKNIAVSRPFEKEPIGCLEISLCRKWGISGVICRESGGVIQRSWQQICFNEKIDLWLISRPSPVPSVAVASSINQLIDITSYKYL